MHYSLNLKYPSYHVQFFLNSSNNLTNVEFTLSDDVNDNKFQIIDWHLVFYIFKIVAWFYF